MTMALSSYRLKRTINLPPSAGITDRARRYRAQNATPGPRRCVVCNGNRDLQAMHLSGDEADGEPENLAWGCRSCNQVLSAAFIRIGSPVRTAQYNPAGKSAPTYGQYIWAVKHHQKGANDEGGEIIHATPRHKRIQYARLIAAWKAKQKGDVPF